MTKGTLRPLPRSIVVVSGIWPPDVGGPATHAAELAEFLARRGHRVRGVTTGAQRLEPSPFPVRRLRREVSLSRRMIEGAAVLTRAAVTADVLYATGLFSRSALASVTTRTPLVIKLVNDPAYERARSLGVFSGTLEEFQEPSGSAPIRALKLLRRAALAQARQIIVPSRYLARLAMGWGIPAGRLDIIPNPVPSDAETESRESLRSRLDIREPTLVFAGRFVQQKNLPLAIGAVARVPGVKLVLVGDGPDGPRLRELASRTGVSERVRFEGPTTRRGVLDWLRAADASVLPSAWENFPYAVVEALSVGTPVVATAVGGVPEIIEPQVNGLLVPADDVNALASAIRSLMEDDDLRSSLSAGARATRRRFAPEPTFEAIERVLVRAASR